MSRLGEVGEGGGGEGGSAARVGKGRVRVRRGRWWLCHYVQEMSGV